MPIPAQPAANGDFSLSAEYSTPYNAVIRGEIVMGVPRYFLERWLPVLGPDPAALVNTLRQLDYRASGGVTISGAALAREAGMSRRHLYTCLQAPWLAAFVRTVHGGRTQAADGTLQQQPNRYLVRMDDPLTPADADRLVEVLTHLADTPLEAARRALDLEPRALWAPDPSQRGGRFVEPRAITARDALLRAFPAWTAAGEDEQQALNEQADALHRHVTLVREDGRTSKVIVPQYFRQQWWKRLGHDRAWAYLWLRGQVYDNPTEGIQRDTCWVPALEALLTVLGRPREWWRRNVENAAADGEGWALTDFFRQTDAQKGRDPAHPQWVARQFVVALQIPIAPEDRARYERLLQEWPPEGIVPGEGGGSTTNGPAGSGEVRHKRTHRSVEGPPHTDTPDPAGSATPVHTGGEGVRHTGAQGSATNTHRESESTHSAPSVENPASVSSSIPAGAGIAEVAAAETPAAEAENQAPSLSERIAYALEHTPDLPLYRTASARTWLEQAWAEPVRPHTPAWVQVEQGRVAPRDLVALMLGISADPSVQHAPRYLSWVIQRWQALPDAPPVDRWPEWQALAALPVGEWAARGPGIWRRLVAAEYRALPFGLEALLAEYEAERRAEEPAREGAARPAGEAEPVEGAGLDERPGGGNLTIRDIWIAALGELRVVLDPTIFRMWLEGARPLGYEDGVLTVRARHRAARDELTLRFNASLETLVAKWAGEQVRIRYVAE